MSFNRTQHLQSRVLRILSQYDHKINPDVIIEELNNAQEELCRDYFAFEDHVHLMLEAGKNKYDLSGRINKIASILYPATWTRGLDIVEGITNWKKFIDDHPESASAGFPEGVMVWNNYLFFHPLPTTDGESLEVFLYGLPIATITLDSDPEIGHEWDDALTYGALKNIMGADMRPEFERTAKAAQNRGMKKTTAGVITTEHFTDGIGF